MVVEEAKIGAKGGILPYALGLNFDKTMRHQAKGEG
jgi:hypothetical protein